MTSIRHTFFDPIRDTIKGPELGTALQHVQHNQYLAERKRAEFESRIGELTAEISSYQRQISMVRTSKQAFIEEERRRTEEAAG